MIIFPQRSNAFKSATGQVTARHFVSSSSQVIRGSAIATAVPLTIAAWVRANSTSQPGLAVGVFKTAASANGFYITLANTTLRPAAISVANNTYRIATDTSDKVIDTWYCLVGVFASTTSRKIYLNGTEVGSDTNTSAPSGIDNTAIGAFYANGTPVYGNCDIADAAFWNVALTTGEIADYAAGKRADTIAASSLLGAYRQNNGSLLTAYAGTAPQTLTAYNTPTEVSDGPVLYL